MGRGSSRIGHSHVIEARRVDLLSRVFSAPTDLNFVIVTQIIRSKPFSCCGALNQKRWNNGTQRAVYPFKSPPPYTQPYRLQRCNARACRSWTRLSSWQWSPRDAGYRHAWHPRIFTCRTSTYDSAGSRSSKSDHTSACQPPHETYNWFNLAVQRNHYVCIKQPSRRPQHKRRYFNIFPAASYRAVLSGMCHLRPLRCISLSLDMQSRLLCMSRWRSAISSTHTKARARIVRAQFLWDRQTSYRHHHSRHLLAQLKDLANENIFGWSDNFAPSGD